MTRIPIQPGIKKVSQIMMEQQAPEPAAATPEPAGGVNEYGEIVTQPAGVGGFANNIIANLKLTVKYAESQIAALEQLTESGDDSAFAERLPGPENDKWWDKKGTEANKIRDEVMTFLPLIPQTLEEDEMEVPEAPAPEQVSEEPGMIEGLT